jgi:hypothetical protein
LSRRDLTHFSLPALGFEKRQGTAPPAVRLVLQLPEQSATVCLAQFPVDQPIDLPLLGGRLCAIFKQTHCLTSINHFSEEFTSRFGSKLLPG